MLTGADKKLIDATLEINSHLEMIAKIDASFDRLNKLEDEKEDKTEKAQKTK